MASPSLREFLAGGPFTLSLSAGFFGFFAHAGFLAALDEAEIRPARVTGASAGALAGGAWAAGLSGVDLGAELFGLKREDFWDVRFGLGVLRGQLFRARLEALLPVRSFEACRVPFAATVFDILRWRTTFRDSGELAPAICASCAVPGMFHPVWIEGRPHWDGGIFERAALGPVAPPERVLLHFLKERSPWRRPDSRLLRPPVRDHTLAIMIDGLPRVSPFRLEHGRAAFEAARDHARRLLA